MAVLTLDPSKVKIPPLPFVPDVSNYIIHSKPMSPTMRKKYIKDRAQAAVTYITEYGNTRLWTLEKLAPTHKLTQRLQVIFGKTNEVKEAVDKAIECDDEIRRKKCIHTPEDMGKKETSTWIGWIHTETQALIEDMNEEIKLQNEEDDLFTKNIVYAPLNSIQEREEAPHSGGKTSRNNFSSKISPKIQQEEKLASPLPVERTNNPLPQRTRSKHSEIPPVNYRNPQNKPPVHSTRVNNTRCQINYDNLYWEGNDTSYLQMPNIKQQPVLEQFSINDTMDIRLCHQCGGEGHIRKYCNVNVHCDFCKSYSHHTSVCRLYANFVRAHPMASSRRTSPAQLNKQMELSHPP